VFERAELETRFLHRFAIGAGVNVFILDRAGNRFQHMLAPIGKRRRRAELAYQDRGAPLRVVRQHAHRAAVILDFSLYPLAVRQFDRGNQQPAEAFKHGLRVGDLRHGRTAGVSRGMPRARHIR
jgi:hypothetical protein